MRTKYALLVSLLFVLSLVACSSASRAPQTVKVSMNDYGFTLSPDMIKPGDVTFIVKNDATSILHQMMIVKTYLPADQLPDALSGPMVDEGTGEFTVVGAVKELDPGTFSELKLKLDTGHYVYFCNTVGHYRMGMYGEFTIAP